MWKHIIFLGALCMGQANATHAGLMIPDIANDRIMLFDHVTGHLVDANWITDAGAIGWGFTTPYDAMLVNNEIWVSDRGTGVSEGAIRRFDASTRAYNSSITTRYGGGALNQPQGLASDGAHVYLTHTGPTSTAFGIIRYDTNGVPDGFFNINNNMQDIAILDGDLLASNLFTNSIQRRSANDGSLINDFAAGFTSPRQVSVLSDNSVLSLSSANPGAGVYHFNSDGTVRRYFATSPLSGFERGVFFLNDGNYLVTTSTGVFKYDIASATFEEIMGNVDAQFINFIPEPTAITLFAASLLFFSQRRDHRSRFSSRNQWSETA